MKEWFDEWFEVHGRWGRHNSYRIYNPLTGELYVHNVISAASVLIAGANFFCYMQMQEFAFSVFLGIVAIVLGLLGLVLSFMQFPKAFAYKSIFRVGVVLFGIIFSLLGILITVATFVFVIAPTHSLIAH